VSFSELRAAGIEFPASIVSELELAGIAIERCRGTGSRGASVRLAPAAAPPVETAAAPPPVEPAPAVTRAAEPPPAPVAARRPKPPPPDTPEPGEHEWSVVRRYRTSSRDGLLLALVSSRRLLAPLALVVAIATAAVIILTGTGHGAGRNLATHVAERPHSRAPAKTTATQATTATTPPATATTPPATASTTPAPTLPTPVSLTLATQLESQGHDLLTSGQYTAALPVLRRAVAATGENVSACVQPESTMCLTYAYALYDLGRALRLSGNPAAAVPILESRLEIDNQRPTVLAELELARQGAT